MNMRHGNRKQSDEKMAQQKHFEFRERGHGKFSEWSPQRVRNRFYCPEVMEFLPENQRHIRRKNMAWLKED